MTAVNLFADDRMAYLSTDGATFNCDDGRIGEFGTKAAMFPDQRLVIATSGRAPVLVLLEALDRHVSILTQAAMLEALPAAVADLRERLRAEWPDEERRGLNHVRVWVAAFDMAAGVPRALAIFSDAYENESASDAYKLREIEGMVSPALAPDEMARVLPEGYITDPKEDTCRILQAQRQVPFPLTGGRCGVGGHCDFFTVGPDGVTGERILSFPDAVGEVPDPQAEAVRL